jgi:hypothetical protein
MHEISSDDANERPRLRMAKADLIPFPSDGMAQFLEDAARILTGLDGIREFAMEMPAAPARRPCATLTDAEVLAFTRLSADYARGARIHATGALVNLADLVTVLDVITRIIEP